MEHFAFPGNIDFAADDQGAFHVLFMKADVFIHRARIGQSRANYTEQQAQQVAGNPCR